jgi:transcriptional regulator with XRE-family HTH domain
MNDNLVEVERRAILDYRLALGLYLREQREGAAISLSELSTRCRIPAETLRSYERGAHQPQIMRLARIGEVYGVSALEMMISTAEYVYRANGEPIPDTRTTTDDRIALAAALLYCGLLPTQIPLVEAAPTRLVAISDDE